MYMRWAQGSEPTALPEVGFVQAADYSGFPYFPEPQVTVDSENAPEAIHLRPDADRREGAQGPGHTCCTISKMSVKLNY